MPMTMRKMGNSDLVFKEIYSAWCPASLPKSAKNTTMPSITTVTKIKVICAVREFAAPVKLPFLSAPPTAVATGPIKLTPIKDAIRAKMKATITSTATDAILPVALENDVVGVDGIGIPKPCRSASMKLLKKCLE